MLLCLLVWENCLSNRLSAWLSVSIGANHEGSWGAKPIYHLGCNAWFPQRGTMWPGPVAEVLTPGPYLHVQLSKPNTASGTPHLARFTVCVTDWPVLMWYQLASQCWTHHPLLCSETHLRLFWTLSHLSVEPICLRNFLFHRTSNNIVLSLISVGLSSPCLLRDTNEKRYSHFSDGEQKHRKTYNSLIRAQEGKPQWSRSEFHEVSAAPGF